ncbi:unnamed protein product [Staurois parvus]|uniref:Uncharacterized protein n=1 Tax=Staurois parvus TaxID=386267 RepID=A0ABN9DV01_9NEOB|nr:unnamed protein product [Staurois parvus]
MGLLSPRPHSNKPMKGSRGISWGPQMTPGPRAMTKYPDGESTPGHAATLLGPPRGGLTTHGAPGNRGSWGPCLLAQTQKSL